MSKAKLYCVNEDGGHSVPKLGWDWLAGEMAADKDHAFTGCRWAIALAKDGTVVKVYEGRGATVVSGRGSCPLRLRGRDAEAFIQKVNQRLGHTEEDVLAILANSSPPS
jgi:hypothetical protein